MAAYLPKPPGPDAVRDLRTCIHCESTATPSAFRCVEMADRSTGYECRDIEACESRIVRLPWWQVAS